MRTIVTDHCRTLQMDRLLQVAKVSTRSAEVQIAAVAAAVAEERTAVDCRIASAATWAFVPSVPSVPFVPFVPSEAAPGIAAAGTEADTTAGPD